MATDHRDLVSSETHEPKHISDTTAADAGKVITPLSGGSSELRNLTPEEVGVNRYYGEIGLDANASTTAITAASDPTLYTTTDYIHLNSTRIPNAYFDQSYGFTFDDTNKALIVPVNGDYKLSVWMNVKSDTNNSKIGLKMKENGTFANFTIKNDVKDIGRVANISGAVMTDLIAGNPVALYIACDKTANLTIQDIRMNLELLRET